MSLHDQVQKERTKRAFLDFMASAMGVEQNYTTDDSFVDSPPYGYYSINPDTGAAAPYFGTTANGVKGFVITPEHLLIGIIIFFGAKALMKA